MLRSTLAFCALLLIGSAALAQPFGMIPKPPVVKPSVIPQPAPLPPGAVPALRQPHPFSLALHPGDYDFDTPGAVTDTRADFRLVISGDNVSVQAINGATMGHTDPNHTSFAECDTIGYTDQRWLLANVPLSPPHPIAACIHDNGGGLTMITFTRTGATTYSAEGSTWK